MMTKETIDSDPRLSPLAKLLARWVAEQPPGLIIASNVGRSLATIDGQIVEAAFELRRYGILASRIGDVTLPIAQIVMTDDAKKAYAAPQPKVQK